MNYDSIENLNNEQIIELYDDILDVNNFHIGDVYYIGKWNCTVNGQTTSCYVGHDVGSNAHLDEEVAKTQRYYAQCDNGMYGVGIWCEGYYTAVCAAFWGCPRYGFYSDVCPKGCP